MINWDALGLVVWVFFAIKGWDVFIWSGVDKEVEEMSVSEQAYILVSVLSFFALVIVSVLHLIFGLV